MRVRLLHLLFHLSHHKQSALDVRWCADADISAVLFLRPTEEVPPHAAWLCRDDAVVFETMVVETDDDDKGTESWQRVQDVLPALLAFLIGKLKVSLLFFKSLYEGFVCGVFV